MSARPRLASTPSSTSWQLNYGSLKDDSNEASSEKALQVRRSYCPDLSIGEPQCTVSISFEAMGTSQIEIGMFALFTVEDNSADRDHVYLSPYTATHRAAHFDSDPQHHLESDPRSSLISSPFSLLRFSDNFAKLIRSRRHRSLPANSTKKGQE